MTAKVILFVGKELANGEHPLMIRISDDKKKKYRSLGVSLPESKWNKKSKSLKGMKARTKDDPKYKEYEDYLKLRSRIKVIESKYNVEITSLAKEGRAVTIDQLIERVEKPIKKTTVLSYFQDRIDYFQEKGSIGNAEVYSTARNRLKSYLNDKDIRFSDINKSFLKKYREWFEKDGIRDTSISVYLRTLRALYNSAIDDGFAKIVDYPFGRNSVIAGLSKETNKRAITKDEVEKIKSKKVTGKLKDAQNYFIFGYHGWGINFIDIALLRWKDIVDDRVSYIREKTKGKKQKKISFPVTNQIEEVLSCYRSLTGVDKENYIFPILNRHIHITPKQKKNRIRKVITQTNSDLKDLAIKAEVKTKLTTYVWRHTFATVLKNELNISTAVISEMMAHSGEGVTATYLADFDDTVKDKAAEGL
jgi:integrase